MFKILAFCPSPHARTRPQIHRAPFAKGPDGAPDHPFVLRGSPAVSQIEPAQKGLVDYLGITNA
jgi:hypothetical protein